MIIEVTYNGKQIILFNFAAPGTSKNQDAYMSELTGLYHMIYIIEKIREKHNISIRGITAACDRLNEIKKSMDANTTYSCQ